MTDDERISELLAENAELRAALRACAEVLSVAGKKCDFFHHSPSDQHGIDIRCPVEVRAEAALSLPAVRAVLGEVER